MSQIYYLQDTATAEWVAREHDAMNCGFTFDTKEARTIEGESTAMSVAFALANEQGINVAVITDDGQLVKEIEPTIDQQ